MKAPDTFTFPCPSCGESLTGDMKVGKPMFDVDGDQFTVRLTGTFTAETLAHIAAHNAEVAS